jgi:hypothetical protein
MKRFLLGTLLFGLAALAAPSRAAAQTLEEDRCACEREYEACNEVCRALSSPLDRALCWGACTTAYGACLAAAEVRHRLPFPRNPSCNGGSSFGDDVSSAEDCSDDGSGYGGGSGGGDLGGGGGLSCREEYIYIEVDYGDGSGWHTWWEGWATVCE